MSNQPTGAPDCWGRQFQDGDDECGNCPYNNSCRPATLANLNSMHQIRNLRGGPQLPQPHQGYAPPPPPPQFIPRFGGSSLPQPTSYPRVVPTMPQYQAAQQPVAHQAHAPAGWNTPIAFLPRPNPANPAWWQYAGETTGARLGKNILLNMFQALFAELLRFFSNWTWPARTSTT